MKSLRFFVKDGKLLLVFLSNVEALRFYIDHDLLPPKAKIVSFGGYDNAIELEAERGDTRWNDTPAPVSVPVFSPLKGVTADEVQDAMTRGLAAWRAGIGHAR